MTGPQLNFEASRTEFIYLKDILGMWIDGCEGELKSVSSDVPNEDVHWAANGMREMIASAMEMHLRMEVMLTDG